MARTTSVLTLGGVDYNVYDADARSALNATNYNIINGVMTFKGADLKQGYIFSGGSPSGEVANDYRVYTSKIQQFPFDVKVVIKQGVSARATIFYYSAGAMTNANKMSSQTIQQSLVIPANQWFAFYVYINGSTTTLSVADAEKLIWIESVLDQLPNMLQYRGSTTAALSTLKAPGVYAVAKANASAIGLPSGMTANYGYLIAITNSAAEFYLIESSSTPIVWRYAGSWYQMTDATLNIQGAPADSKAVRDNLFIYHGATTNFDTATPGIWSFAKANVSASLPSDFNTSYGYFFKMHATQENATQICMTSSAGIPTIWIKLSGGSWVRLNNIKDDGINGKKIAFIGDSITEYNSTATANYVKLFETNGGATVQNLGRSGVGYCRYHENDTNFISKIASIADDTDYIVVAGSFNDLGSTEPLGTPSDTGATTICGYINAFYDALQEAFPETPVFAFAMNYWESFEDNPSRFLNYVDALETICRNRAIPFFDVGKKCGIRPWETDNKTAFCPDSTHPNNDGHARMYPIIKNAIKSVVDIE